MSLRDQIEAAGKSVRRLKRTNPYIFPQWDRLQRAKRNLEAARQELKAARQELKAAKAAWNALGAKRE